jgi:hypothetical protein
MTGMKHLTCSALLVVGAVTLLSAQAPPKPTSLFDGKTLAGWEGDTKMWRVEDGAIVGGSLAERVPHNDFLCTTREYANFVLQVKFKLVGNDGFVNSGVQFRSQRAKEPAYEMVGYQADLGDTYWGSLYDESRRNKTLAAPEASVVTAALKPNDWNDYEVRAEGPRIRISLNGRQTVDYTETDTSIPQSGIIGLQIHGGGKAQVSFKDINIAVLK